jgi:hypothetical protein
MKMKTGVLLLAALAFPGVARADDEPVTVAPDATASTLADTTDPATQALLKKWNALNEKMDNSAYAASMAILAAQRAAITDDPEKKAAAQAEAETFRNSGGSRSNTAGKLFGLYVEGMSNPNFSGIAIGSQMSMLKRGDQTARDSQASIRNSSKVAAETSFFIAAQNQVLIEQNKQIIALLGQIAKAKK